MKTLSIIATVLAMLLFIILIPVMLQALTDIAPPSIETLNGWESLGVVHNMKFTDCYGREYTSMSKFLGNTGVWLPDKTRMNINNLPTDKFYKVYKKDYWLIPTSYLVICTGD